MTCAVAAPSPGDFLVHQWTSDHGLPQNSILDITQTRDGYLWLATFGGLVRFDGYDFVTFDETTPGLSSNRFLALHEDDQGRLWIGTQYDGVFVWEGGHFRPCGPDQGCPEGHIRDILPGLDGALWFSTPRGVFQRKDNALRTLYRVTTTEFESPNLALDPKGNLWGNTRDTLLRLQGDVMAPVPCPPIPEPAIDLSMLGDDPLVRTLNHLYRLHNNQWEEVALPGPPVDIDHWLLRFVHVDARGNIWVDHDGRLWVRTPEGEWRAALPAYNVNSSNEREHVEITSFFVDREGSSWVGTNRLGLFQVQDLGLTRFFGSGATMAGYSLTGNPRGEVFASVNCREIIRVDLQGQLQRQEIKGQQGCGNSLLLDRRGRLWVTTQLDIWRLQGDQHELLWREPEPAVGRPNVLFERPSGELLIGIRHRGLYEEGPDGALRAAPWAAALPDNTLRALAQGPRGELWVGADGGLARFHEGRWDRWTEGDGAPPGSLRALWVDERGVLWVGSYGGGLGRFDGQRWTRYRAQDGLYENAISLIAPDRYGGLWLNGNRGLSRVLLGDLEAFARNEHRQLHARSIPSGEGNGGVQPAGWMSPEGILWAPTIYGPVRLDTTRPRADAPPPLAAIEQIRFSDLEPVLSPNGTILAPAGHRGLSVEFASLTFLTQQRPLLQHRLSPYDKDWSAPDRRQRATWAALSPGTYKLEVRTRNAEGLWGAPTSLDLVIPAYFYETIWFRISASLAVLGLALAFHRWRLRLRDQRHQALQREIVARQQAQEAQRDLSERLQRAERLEVLGRLAGGIAHDFNNLLAALQGAAQLQRLDLKKQRLDDASQQNQLILDCVQRASRMTASLLAFGRRPNAPARPTDLAEAITQMSRLLQRLLKGNVHFSLSLPEQPAWALIDPGQLDRVLLNLCLNANDAMPDGGDLTLRVTHDNPEGRPGAWLTLWVEDTGVGMTEAVRQRLFDPFFTTRAAEGGTGLGLAVVVDAVQHANGYLSVSSAPAQGTRFGVSLPLLDHDPAPRPARASTPDSAAAREDRLILLAEDDSVVLRTISHALRHLGYRLYAEPDMARCLQRATALHEPPDLLITDVMMPDGDGPSLARALRERHPDLPVLFISGYTAGVDLDGLGDDNTAFLQKPFSLADLERAVKALLARPS